MKTSLNCKFSIDWAASMLITKQTPEPNHKLRNKIERKMKKNDFTQSKFDRDPILHSLVTNPSSLVKYGAFFAK